jgi:hypothetical protein
LTLDSLDPAAFAMWVDGAEKPVTVKEGPRLVLWTRTSAAEWQGVTFGESKHSGSRHLRLGWNSPVTVGSLFVAELFKDVRRGPTWSMPVAQRGMLLNDLTLHDENFWPSITQTKDAKVSLSRGRRAFLARARGRLGDNPPPAGDHVGPERR